MATGVTLLGGGGNDARGAGAGMTRERTTRGVDSAEHSSPHAQRHHIRSRAEGVAVSMFMCILR